MKTHPKIRRILLLQYIVVSRWFLHAGIVLLGLMQKVIGTAEFNPAAFLLLAVSYAYNGIFYWYLHRPVHDITQKGLRRVAILQVLFDQILYTIVLYVSGGVESLSFMFYVITILIAVVLFSEYEILLITAFTIVLYAGLIWLEYTGLIPHFSRYDFDPGFYQNLGVTMHNSATIVLIFVFIAFLAAFVSNLIRAREREVLSERDKLDAIVDNLVDGVLLLNKEGRVIIMNPYAQRVLHVNAEEYIGQALLPAQFSKSLSALLEFIHEAATTSVYRNEEITVKEAKDSLILRVTAVPIASSEGGTFGTLVIMRNITREKDLDQMKSEFISVAAHQLRTPLATLKWLFKIMLDGDAGDLTDKQRDLLVKGFSRNNEVIEIVNNLLDVSEIEEGRFPYKFVTESLSSMLQKLADETQDAAAQKDITIDAEIPDDLPPINHDRQKLKMAVQNLLDNAVKYSHDSGSVHVRAFVEGDSLHISVKDSGIGMSEETQERVFTKFYRGKEAAAHESTGSGLGLYIVRNILQRHAGEVHVESTLGHGSTFTITLPIAE